MLSVGIRRTSSATICSAAGTLKEQKDHIAIQHQHWYLGSMDTARKVTVEVPSALLRKAQKSTGQGITATIRQGLELVAASRAYEGLRRLRGKVGFSINCGQLREDRR